MFVAVPVFFYANVVSPDKSQESGNGDRDDMTSYDPAATPRSSTQVFC